MLSVTCSVVKERPVITETPITRSAPIANGKTNITAPAEPSPAAEFLPAASDPALAELQSLLGGEQRARIVELRAQVEHMRALLHGLEQELAALNNSDVLAHKIKPSLAPAIKATVHESRAEMVDALYPIIGQLVARAVAEALRDLARRIDEQMRRTLDLKMVAQRIQARVGGVSEAELVLRTALPFQVLEIFLIHRESGLLLHHLSQDPTRRSDSDLISGMLTAIRDFVQDAFGRGQAGELDEVQYGDKAILLESARYVYSAVVTEGSEPLGLRGEIRRHLFDFERKHLDYLRTYTGDAAPFVTATEQFAPLLIKQTAPRTVQRPATPTALYRRQADTRLAFGPQLTLSFGLLAGMLALWHLWHQLG